jgi:hypothetical protein
MSAKKRIIPYDNDMKRLLRYVFFSTLIMSCSHMSDKFMQVKVGMDQATVQQMLGAPDNRAFSNNKESWLYPYFDWKEGNVVKIVEFENGKVTGLHDDEIAKQRQHEIQKAKAGATQIQLGSTSVSGFSASPYPAFKPDCREWNAFGHYPTGGGCNAFGCWPAGGSCSAFGCSLSGDCGAVSCPQKYHHLDCQ